MNPFNLKNLKPTPIDVIEAIITERRFSEAEMEAFDYPDCRPSSSDKNPIKTPEYLEKLIAERRKQRRNE